jgi:zinc protease
MRETADRLLILAPEVDKERGVILSEKRLRDTPDYRALLSNLEFMLPQSLVPQRFPIGLETVITEAPRQRFVDFYQTWYRPERMTLVIVGAIDIKSLTERIAAHFDSMRAKTPAQPNPDIGTIAARGTATRMYADPDAQAEVVLETVSDADPGADTRAIRERDAALYIANGVISRRLASLALKGNAPFIQGAAQVNDVLRFARIGSITMQCKPEDWKEALAVAEQELRRALKYGFAASELEEQKKSLRSNFEQQARSAGTRESPQIANDVVEHLTSFNVFTHPQYDLDELDRVLPGITAERAQSALRELWGDRGPLVFLAGPYALKAPEAEILAALEQSRKQPVEPPQDGALQNFAYATFGTPTQIVERKTGPALDVVQIRFGNNVRLNLKPTKFEANTILVGVRFGAGRLELPREKPGLVPLAEGTFLAGGLEKHDLDELNRITAGHNVGLDFSVDDDAFLLNGRTTPDDLPLELQVMAAYISAPGFRPQALQRFRDGLGPLYLNITRTPSGVLQSRVSRLLRDGDPRFGYPDKEEAMKRTLEELRSWMAQPLATSYLEISLVGDFDVEAALRAVSATFGALPMRQATKPPYTEQRKVHFPEMHTLQTFTFQSQDPKSLAAAYWPTTDFGHISEVRRLFVLAQVLESRVLDRIRVKEGNSYTARGGHNPSIAFPDYGFMYAIVDATPAKAASLTTEIEEVASEIVKSGVTQDELERARNPLVNELKKRLNDNNYILSALVIASQEQPERLARIKTAVKELESLTVDNLNEVARKYLVPEKALPVAIIPTKNGANLTPAPRAAAEVQ